jgi:hypothetical protein
MDDQSLEAIAELICGDNAATAPLYRSSSMLTRFFASAGLSRFQHDGSTRKWWTLDALKSCSPDELRAVIRRLASPREYRGDAKATKLALETLNRILQLEGLKVELRNAQPTMIPVPIDFDMGTDADEHELKPLPPPDFTALGLDVGVGPLLNQRWNEAQICVDRGAYLSATIAMGGLLEALLLGVLLTRPEIAIEPLRWARETNARRVLRARRGSSRYEVRALESCATSIMVSPPSNIATGFSVEIL